MKGKNSTKGLLGGGEQKILQRFCFGKIFSYKSSEPRIALENGILFCQILKLCICIQNYVKNVQTKDGVLLSLGKEEI